MTSTRNDNVFSRSLAQVVRLDCEIRWDYDTGYTQGTWKRAGWVMKGKKRMLGWVNHKRVGEHGAEGDT